MKRFLAALLVVAFSHGLAPAQTGPFGPIIKAWEGPTMDCRHCHGAKGEGGFGPDLAGRRLTVAQFKQAVRKPWGIMPTYGATEISDDELTQLARYFNRLPTVDPPAKWRYEIPPGAPRGQAVSLGIGCGQCHGPNLDNPRAHLGAVNGDFAWFKAMVYDHNAAMAQHFKALKEPPRRLRMGNYSPMRVAESQLQEIYDWARDIGLRARVSARLGKGAPAADGKGVTYTLTVRNSGLAGKGVVVEDMTISLAVPKGTKSIEGTGTGYEGLRKDDETKRDAAVWLVPRLAPGEEQTFTVTLPRAATAADNLQGTVRWTKPAVKTGPFDKATIAAAPL